MKEIIEEIKLLDVGKIEENVSLKRYTTYRCGGNARCVVYPRDIKSLINLLSFLKENRATYKILGNGSNLLFSDKNYEGILIRLSEFNKIKFINKRKIRVGAGYSLIKLSLLAAKKGLTGLEFAAGIPGTVGGAVFMNAGAYKSDMGYIVESVKVLTPQPLEYPSAGSVFRNPPDQFAGKLIEDVGLKGMKKGGAMVSDKHANFIVNYKNASSSDVKYLIDACHDKVLETYGIDMKIEQEFVNWE